jgi:Na+/H+ antiporter NhaD/arsenite permease-like protein
MAIFAASYLALAIGKVPGLSIDRAGVALVGACLMVASGVVSPEEAYQAVDVGTITLLLGMMIVVASLRISGFFALVNAWVARHIHRPVVLLAAIVALSGVFSAFLVNDAICLVMAPLVMELTLALGRNPVPYLLAVAMASNVGSTATITGNPQNMMIGSFSGISYRHFLAVLAPPSIAGLVLVTLVIFMTYRSEFRSHQHVAVASRHVRVDRKLMWKAIIVSLAMIVMFFAGWPVPKVAIVAGAVLLITRRVDPEKIYSNIDWGLLAMFAGLFVVIAGIEKTSLDADLVALAGALHLNNVFLLSGLATLLSNLVSNVPAVLVFKPFVGLLANPQRAWLTLAMSSTLAGNLTILGSVANLIVVQQARRRVKIGFWEYFRVGAPLSAITILLGAAWIAWRIK